MGTPSAALIGEEIVVTSVEPQHEYWLWVGGSRRSTALPVSYVVHVCGTTSCTPISMRGVKTWAVRSRSTPAPSRHRV
jgi:hypothetical protein